MNEKSASCDGNRTALSRFNKGTDAENTSTKHIVKVDARHTLNVNVKIPPLEYKFLYCFSSS